MEPTDLAVARLRLATDQAEALQRGLHHRQDDLLALEESVRHMSTGRSNGRVVIDQAEDIRRAINIHTTEQVPEIWSALTLANRVVADAAADGTLAPDRARMLSHMASTAGEETRRATMDLDDVDEALIHTAQAVPGESSLAETAQEGIDQAAGRLENARRAVFRMVEDLPVITRAVQDIPENDPASVDRDVSAQPAAEAQPSLGLTAEQRQPPPMSSTPTAGFSPGW